MCLENSQTPLRDELIHDIGWELSIGCRALHDAVDELLLLIHHRRRALRRDLGCARLRDAAGRVPSLAFVGSRPLLPPLQRLRHPLAEFLLGCAGAAREQLRKHLLQCDPKPVTVPVRAKLLSEHGLQIGGGLGDFKGKAWRIGLMGASATPLSTDHRCLAVLSWSAHARRNPRAFW